MEAKLQYKLLKSYRSLLGYGYRGLKKLVRLYSYYQTYLGSIVEALRTESVMPEMERVTDRYDLQQYRRRWRRLSSKSPAVFLRLFSTLSGVKSADYLPASLYYTHVEPMLNNRDYGRTFEDKNMYALIFDKQVQPPVLLRRMHGTYLDTNYKPVEDVEKRLTLIAEKYEKVILKPSIASHGGQSVRILKSRNGHLFSGGEIIERDWLEKVYGYNFLIQCFVQQHPFYSAFNASSLNTLRIFTYRSVVDERIHVLQSVLRVGKPGSFVDNQSMGGIVCGISPQGTLNGIAVDKNGGRFTRVGKLEIKEGIEIFKYQEMTEQAQAFASREFYSRLIGFDFCIEKDGQVRFIELNNFDVAVDMMQQCNGPLFREFTDEILDYCARKKQGFRYQVR